MPERKNEAHSPVVSVVIPVYNDREGLYGCLSALSALERSESEVEVIVVDNGSSPPLDPADDYPLPVRLVTCNTSGSYAARNAGAVAARGRILAFTDADCIPDAGWIRHGVAAVDKNSERSVIGGEVLFIAPRTRTGTALYQATVGFQQQENVEHRAFAATANLFCTMTQFWSVGPFDERLLSGGDREWCWRAARHGVSIHFEPDAIVRTQPRLRLSDAIRQARRVAAGRAALGDDGPSNREGLRRHRSIIQSLVWIFSVSDLTPWERLKVLTAATMIRLATAVEIIRLKLGFSAERR